MTPGETIHAYCIECLGRDRFNAEMVRDCKGDTATPPCSFYKYRLGGRVSVKVIRKFCVHDCMNGYFQLISDCAIETCPNHPYRFGKSPARKGMGFGRQRVDERATKP
jgi:hypothetical protein